MVNDYSDDLNNERIKSDRVGAITILIALNTQYSNKVLLDQMDMLMNDKLPKSKWKHVINVLVSLLTR